MSSLARVVALVPIVVALVACKGVLRAPVATTDSVPPRPPPGVRDQGAADSPATRPTVNPLSAIKYWAYQIQGLTKSGAVDALVSSRYDMFVLEPTRTDRNTPSFDSKGMVQRLHQSSGKSGKPRLVIAYLDIGEAESWRYYWNSGWTPPTKSEVGDPSFLVMPDPDGWAHNYPVAYWDARWKEIIIKAADSMLQRAIDDGYDGVYLDWIEGFSQPRIRQEAKAAGKDATVEMIAFIKELRAHARAQRPDFLVIAQNGAELAVGHPEYLAQIDAIAQEQIFFDGDADTAWSDGNACDKRVPDTGAEYSRAHYGALLAAYAGAGLPVFNVEYACEADNVADAYSLSAARGYVPYVSRRPLSRLTPDPPPGY